MQDDRIKAFDIKVKNNKNFNIQDFCDFFSISRRTYSNYKNNYKRIDMLNSMYQYYILNKNELEECSLLEAFNSHFYNLEDEIEELKKYLEKDKIIEIPLENGEIKEISMKKQTFKSIERSIKYLQELKEILN